MSVSFLLSRGKSLRHLGKQPIPVHHLNNAQVNDRLIALVNSVPFRPFTLQLCDARKWRITSPDRLELFLRGGNGAHVFVETEHPLAPDQVVLCVFMPEEVLAIE
jgi:hypothetical protein